MSILRSYSLRLIGYSCARAPRLIAFTVGLPTFAASFPCRKSITMEPMLCRTLLRCSFLLALSGILLTSVSVHAQDSTSNKWGRKYKAPPPSSRIEVTILKDDNGKPIENAAVIFHPIEGDKDKGALELKTNEDGKAIIDVIPMGDTVRLQVIANGFQTYGQDYKVDKAEMAMKVRMKRPGAQYSIYKNNGATANSGGDKQAAPPANNGNGSGQANQGKENNAQPDSQSGQNQSQDQAQPK